MTLWEIMKYLAYAFFFGGAVGGWMAIIVFIWINDHD